ncbi:transposase-like protein [Paraphaeosphaeria sporulosa]
MPSYHKIKIPHTFQPLSPQSNHLLSSNIARPSCRVQSVTSVANEQHVDPYRAPNERMFGAVRKKAHKRQRRTSQLDEYFDSLYGDRLTSSASPDMYKLMQDPHCWWVDVGQKRYPVVYKMAMDHPSVPATSCDCERCFSSARRTITCDRNQLSPAVVEALQLQKNWVTRDAVSSHLTALSKHVVKKDAC